jgi:hypothetical protein
MRRVYIGPANLANFSDHLEKSLTSNGIKADFIAWSYLVHPFEYDKMKIFKVVNKPPFKIFGKNIFYSFNEYFLKPLYFLYALIKYDVFLFIKPTTFFRKNSDLKILKFFNKKIGVFNLGCADRNVKFDSDPEYICNTCADIAKQKNFFCHKINIKIEKVNFFERYANYIFGPPDTVSYVRDKYKVHNYVMPMPAIIIQAAEKNFNGRLRISHLPSNPLLKGTYIIEPILNRLAEEEDIDIMIKKEMWPRERIIQELKNTHIVIDSLASYIFGTLSLEAIKYGCVVLNAYPNWIAKYYDIPPVVKVTGNSLYNTLKELISNQSLLKQYAERSQEAYNKYFTYKVAGKYYKDILSL